MALWRATSAGAVPEALSGPPVDAEEASEHCGGGQARIRHKGSSHAGFSRCDPPRLDTIFDSPCPTKSLHSADTIHIECLDNPPKLTSDVGDGIDARLHMAPSRTSATDASFARLKAWLHRRMLLYLCMSCPWESAMANGLPRMVFRKGRPRSRSNLWHWLALYRHNQS